MGGSTGSANWGRRDYDWGLVYNSASADRSMAALGGGKAAGRARGLRIGGRNTRIEVASRMEDLDFGTREKDNYVGRLSNRWRKAAEEGCKCWRRRAGRRRRTEGWGKEDRSRWGWGSDWEWDSGFVDSAVGGSRCNRRCALCR